jgi:O-glycosyl hydrolase
MNHRSIRLLGFGLALFIVGPSCSLIRHDDDKIHEPIPKVPTTSQHQNGGASTEDDLTGGTDTGGNTSVGGTSFGTTSDNSGSGGTAAIESTTTVSCVGMARTDASTIDPNTEYQIIRGFGGINMPGWIADLTTDEADKAFGNGEGQIGLSLLRVRVPFDNTKFELEVPTALRAVSHGVTVFASPWSPPIALKTNNALAGGTLRADAYSAYADHLVSFRDYLASSGIPLYAVSIQNEPDVNVPYESCSWDPSDILNFLVATRARFGSTKIMAAESFHFYPSFTDPILNNPTALPLLDIVGGHIYGSGLVDYPLARAKGKELWMTEHYTDPHNANDWPVALHVGKEIHDCMTANFSAYVWWYIRRAYGLITEDSNVSKRGYVMSQFTKFIRPGFLRIAASPPPNPNVYVTAYKNNAQIIVVAVNSNDFAQTVNLNFLNTCQNQFSIYTTSATKNVAYDGVVTLTNLGASVTLEAQSITTYVSH